MGRWAAVGMVALSVGLGACTSDPESAPLPEPVEVETCDGLIPVGVVYVERMVLALEGLSVDVLTGEAEPPNDVAALIQLGADLDQRAARLGCDIDQLNTTILASTSELGADDDPVIGLFLDLVRGGVVGVLEPPPTTTTTTRLPSDS